MTYTVRETLESKRTLTPDSIVRVEFQSTVMSPLTIYGESEDVQVSSVIMSFSTIVSASAGIPRPKAPNSKIPARITRTMSLCPPFDINEKMLLCNIKHVDFLCLLHCDWVEIPQGSASYQTLNRFETLYVQNRSCSLLLWPQPCLDSHSNLDLLRLGGYDMN